MTNASGRNDEYLRTGVEYYISGRFAFLSQMYTSALLFHYGIELIMKSRLLGDSNWNAKKLKYNLGHNLEIIFKEYKKIAILKPSNEIDGAINNLHSWYLVRYPTFVNNKDNTYHLSIQPSNTLFFEGEFNEYKLDLATIDKVFSYLVKSWSFNLEFVLPINSRARDQFFEYNFEFKK